MIRRTLLLLSLIMLAVPVAFAQDDYDDDNTVGFSVGPQVGLFSTSDADDDFNWMVGGALRLRFLPALGLEGSVNYRQEEFYNEDLTVRTWPVMVTGLLYPFPAIYGAIGAGWYNTTFDWDEDRVDLDDETDQEFGWHFGGGLELPLSNQAKLTGDVRWVFLDYEFEAPPGTEDVESDFYVITVGLLFGD